MTVTVKKIGGSLAVVVPNAAAKQMGLTEGAMLDVTADENSLVMRRSGRRPRRPISEIVKQIKPSSYRRHRALLDDPPVGKEIW